jgi:DNA-binding IclR family transcriptional regulator
MPRSRPISEARQSTGPDNDLPAVDAVLRILKLIGTAGQPVNLDMITADTGIAEDLADRLLDRLIRAGYIVKSTDGGFQAAPIVLNFGSGAKARSQPSSIVSSVLHKLVNECAESATFYIADGDDRVCVDRVDAKTALRNYVTPGTRLPLARGAGGHVLVAFNGAVGEQYDRVRHDYIATSIGQLEADEASMAAPVFGPDGGLFGALLVSGPTEDFTPEFMERLRPLLLKRAAELTVALGGSARQFPSLE